MADQKLWRNRKERKEWVRRLRSEDPELEVVHPRAAGIGGGNGARSSRERIKHCYALIPAQPENSPGPPATPAPIDRTATTA
jgi:hypothetical protein